MLWNALSKIIPIQTGIIKQELSNCLVSPRIFLKAPDHLFKEVGISEISDNLYGAHSYMFTYALFEQSIPLRGYSSVHRIFLQVGTTLIRVNKTKMEILFLSIGGDFKVQNRKSHLLTKYSSDQIIFFAK